MVGQLSVPSSSGRRRGNTYLSDALSFVPPNKKRGGVCSLSLGQTKAAAATHNNNTRQQQPKTSPSSACGRANNSQSSVASVALELFLFVSLEWLCSAPFLSLRATLSGLGTHGPSFAHGTPGNDDQEMCLSLFSACLATPSFHALLTPCPSPTPIHITTRTTGLQDTC